MRAGHAPAPSLFLTLIPILFLLALALAWPEPAAADDDDAAQAAWAALAEPGTVGLMRHATAPGFADPPGFRLDDCATQRTLSVEGRREARTLGEEMRRRGLRIDRVLTSRWCRARHTASALAIAPVEEVPALDSFFSAREEGPARTAAVRDLLAKRAAEEKLILVTHQVNIQALAGVGTTSGEVVVVEPTPQGVVVRGRIRPPDP